MPKSNYTQPKKLNKSDELRELLTLLDQKGPTINTMDSTKALILLRELDQVYHLLNQLEAEGADLLAERGRFQTVQAPFKKKSSQILKALGGPKELEHYRPKSTEREQWWWRMDEWATIDRHRLARRVVGIFAAAILVCIGFGALFQYVLAPSPEAIAKNRAVRNAQVALDEQDYDTALSIVQRGLAQAPGDPTLLIYEGVLSQRVGDEVEAQISYEIATKNLAEPTDFYLIRSKVHLQVEQSEAAEADIRYVLTMNEESPQAWLLLGQALEQQGENSQAITAYEKASEFAEEKGENEIAVAARLALGRILR